MSKFQAIRSKGKQARLSKFRIFAAALPFLILLAPTAQAERVIEPFAPRTASAWKPFLKSPPASAAPDGVSFPIPFAKKLDRVAWDKPVALDLSAAVAFELDVACPVPDAMRSLGIYFKSGDGWYAAAKPLLHPGGQRLVYAKGDFNAEGKPAGWHQINGIRISPWKGPNPRNTAIALRRLAAVEGSLVVVRGTSSCPDAGARAVAAKTTDRVSRMLVDAGIGHRIATDDDLPKGALANARAALLPYNPNPTPAQIKALNDFLARGGKLGVFYGASRALADAMGFKLAPYLKADRPDRWRAIAFLEPDAWLAPPRVWQNSPNLMPALPAAPGSRVVARWENARGIPQPEPAIVASPRGFWMSHVVLGDSVSAKTEMLVALCAHLDPSLWFPAARRAIHDAGQINAYDGLPLALAEIRRRLPAAARPDETRGLLDRAASLSAPIAAAMADARPRDALRLARSQRRLLLRADAAVQPSRPGEFVGVWDHDGTGLVPGDWNATAAFLAAHGVNAVFPNLAWGGLAHYPSRHLPPSATLKRYGDQLAASLNAAKAHRLQLHVWLVLWKLDGAPPEFLARMKKEARLQTNPAGQTLPWLSPHHPANRKLLLDVVDEIARNYPGIHGIHLDYIRLPDAQSCYAPTTRARFEADSAQKVAAWPADVLPGGSRNAQFRQWRTRDVSAIVADVRQRLRAAAPTVKLSAAVWGVAHPDGGNIAQRWPDWLRSRSVDFVVPMNYTESNLEFAAWLRTQNAYPNARGRIYAGIGVAANESRLDPAQVARQIQLARQAGCPGFVLFQLNGTLRDETLPALRLGATRP
jgi:uncharacterized lipoprotein YddW (UPF0748 family)